MDRRLGADVSFYQVYKDSPVGIDFTKMKAAGVSFVFIRAGQGAWKDREFDRSWAKAKAAGLDRGAYFFLVHSLTGAKQAEYFWSLIKDDPGELLPVVDYEQSGSTRAAYLKVLRDFKQRMMELAGLRQILYTGPDFWANYGENNPEWKEMPLWIAHYTTAQTPLVPQPWKGTPTTPGPGPMIWQYTSHGDGKKYGVQSGNIDLNLFLGTEADYKALGGMATPPPEKETFMYKDKAIGLYTSAAGWTNPEWDFIVGYAGGNWVPKGGNVLELEPNPNLKAIEEQAHKEGKGKPFIALWDFEVSAYSLEQIDANEANWPPESNDYPLKALIHALENRAVDGLIIRVHNRMNRLGGTEKMAYVAFAAKKFVERANKWLYSTKGLDKWTFVLTSDDFLRTKDSDGTSSQENFYTWLKDWNVGIEQPAVLPLDSGAWPQATDKIRAVPPSKGWRFWFHFNTAKLDMMLYNGNEQDLRGFLGYKNDPITPPPPPVVPITELEKEVAALKVQQAATAQALNILTNRVKNALTHLKGASEV
jgi:GH25 family lysozyme M1 (1,4-beta-N-acetylmuramidase)